MTGNLIQLNNTYFWLMCFAAVVTLVPLTWAAPRKWVLAALNLGFLGLLLRWHALGLIGAVLVVYLLLQGVSRRHFKTASAVLLGLTILGLFLVHKLPLVSEQLGLSPLGHVLSLIGYSYIALRMVEVLRAVGEQIHPPPDLLSLINYLLPFHMLAAGPIQAYNDFVQQPRVPKLLSAHDVLIGVERIAQGVFKKFVLAFVLEKLFLTQFTATNPYFLLELQVFFVWLYLDFSAYSDIAVGLGTLVGVATPENFNRPLLARNLIDFWERWHMSLSQFIRRNLFIPIQLVLMRKTDGNWPLLCTTVAVAISFILCGLWHGLGIPFLIWGSLQAFGLVVAHVYGYYLQKTQGGAWMKRYRANPWVRALATVVTFEFQAFSLFTLFLH